MTPINSAICCHRDYLGLVVTGSSGADSRRETPQPPPICVVGRRLRAMVAYAETCAEWSCDEKLRRVFRGATPHPEMAPFGHGRMKRQRQGGGGRPRHAAATGPALVVADDLVSTSRLALLCKFWQRKSRESCAQAELGAGGMEGGYSEPCVMLVATEVLPQLLASHGHAPHCFVATEPASRAAAEGLLGSWRVARRREFVAAGRRSGREVRESTVFCCIWRYFLLTAARQVGVVEPPAARLLGASAAPSSPARRAAGQEAALHYAAVDLRLSRGQCAACTADLAPAVGEADGAAEGWTMEAVAPRAFAPRG